MLVFNSIRERQGKKNLSMLDGFPVRAGPHDMLGVPQGTIHFVCTLYS
jgi:hypothetical protein